MKAFLVVLLFALTTCAFPEDLFKLAKCVLSSQRVFEVLPKVVEAVKNGDYLTLLQLALTEVPVIKDEVLECMGEPVLKFNCDIRLMAPCVISCNLACRDFVAKKSCADGCSRKYCK